MRVASCQKNVCVQSQMQSRGCDSAPLGRGSRPQWKMTDGRWSYQRLQSTERNLLHFMLKSVNTSECRTANDPSRIVHRRFGSFKEYNGSFCAEEQARPLFCWADGLQCVCLRPGPQSGRAETEMMGCDALKPSRLRQRGSLLHWCNAAKLPHGGGNGPTSRRTRINLPRAANRKITRWN